MFLNKNWCADHKSSKKYVFFNKKSFYPHTKCVTISKVINLKGIKIVMKQKLEFGKIIAVALMLFAMFFGAGNMIFPPMLGHLSGDNFLQSVAGFVVTDAGLSVLAIAAVVFAGSKLDDLAGVIGPKFSVFLGVVVYMLIGPLFALPRTGVVSFEMAVASFVPEKVSLSLVCVIFTAIFFTVTYFLCLNPNKIVDVIGKFLTPFLIISIGIIFVVSIINPVGEIGAATGEYKDIPFFKGLVEGYLALDGLAALVFAIIVINTLKGLGITEKKSITKYTLVSGVLAGLGLALTYMALGYVGAQTTMSEYNNGGQLLASVVNQMLGATGSVILGIAVLLACLTTSIGLASSFSDYFHQLMPKLSYNTLLKIVCIFSFAISNVGLDVLIKVTLPALVMIYPPIITLVLLSFFKKIIKGRRAPYILAMSGAFIVGVFDGMKSAGITLGGIGEMVSRLPFFDLGIGWLVPAIIGCVAGLLFKPIVK